METLKFVLGVFAMVVTVYFCIRMEMWYRRQRREEMEQKAFWKEWRKRKLKEWKKK